MIAYFDCFSGVAGDMVLGALLDAGLPFALLQKELLKLPIKGYVLKRKTARRGVIGGVDVRVDIRSVSSHHHRSYKDIVRMIEESRLNKRVKKLSLDIFDTLAAAEARVHRKRKLDVHFHEVGAIDSIVDIVGAAIGFDYFKFDQIFASSLPMTKGFVTCQHGRIPMPAPATLEILKDVPVYQSPVKAEPVTPTGAAILKTIVDKFNFNPIGTVHKTGYGLGDHDYRQVPNCLRLVIGMGAPLVVFEANIDDMNPQFYDYVIDKLLKQGAIDVTLREVIMKKRRPGVLLQCLCAERDRQRLINTVLRETTTIGVRYYHVSREVLERKTVRVKTKYGLVNVKLSLLGKEVLNLSPEYEDCKRIAGSKGVPIKKVYFEAIKYAS